MESNKQEIKSQEQKRKIALFKFVHQWLYLIVYYFIFSILYAHNFFTNSAIGVKTFLRTWSAASSLMFVLFCLIKIPEVFNINQQRKTIKFAHVILTLLALVYFTCESLRIIEIYHHFGLSNIRRGLNLSLCTVMYVIIFSFSMLISAFYSLEAAKKMHDAKKGNKEITSEVIALVCSSTDAFALLLFVIGYIIGDLEKANMININAEVKMGKLGIFIFCSCLASITVSLSLYDKFRKKEETSVDLEKKENNNDIDKILLDSASHVVYENDHYAYCSSD